MKPAAVPGRNSARFTAQRYARRRTSSGRLSGALQALLIFCFAALVGCGGKPEASAPVTLPPIASAGGPYTGAVGVAVTFTGAASTDPRSETLTYAWSFGDGSTATGVSPTHIYAAAGTFTVSLTVKNTDGLSATATATATVTPLGGGTTTPLPPVASVGGPYTGIAGSVVTFTGAGSTDPKNEPLTYAWSFGDGSTATGVSPTHTYAAAGSFTVSLTVTNTDTLTSTATAKVTITAAPQPPVASAGGPYSGVAGTAITFTGAGSTDPKNETLTYAWSFGDGTTGTGVSPTHTYTTAGSFTVSLTVTNTDTLTSTATAKVTITAAPQPPVASAGGPYTGVAGTAITLTGAGSTDSKSEPLTYAWSFGDGTTGTGVSPTHTYTTAGSFTVSLTVTNTDTLTSTATAKVTITAAPQPPVASAGGPYSGVAGTAVSFTGAASTDPKAETLTYAWSFGDGANAIGVSPTHAYTAPGTFTVSLIVTNTDLLTSTSTAKVTIAAAPLPPVASAGGPYTGVAGTAISLTGAASTDPKSETLTYAWSFGDGTTGTGVSPTHTYASAGTFTASLTVTNTDNLTSTVTAKVTVAAAPQAPVASAGGPYNGTAGIAVTFTGAGSTDPKSEPLTYAWTFGDGSSGSGTSPTHVYTTAGTYTVSLTVTNTDSLTATATAKVTVVAAPQPPVARAGGPYTGVAGTAVTFTGASSTDPKSETLTYAWSFGDGTAGTGVNPTHTYSVAGTFTVSLTVTNTDSLTSTSTATVTISAVAAQPPVARAGGPYTAVAGTAVSFTGAASTDPKNEPLTYAWSFGDGTTSTGVSPTHTYTSAGTFTVSLTVTNTDSLPSTSTATATISAVASQPPVARAGGPYSAVAGTAVSFTGAASTDPKSETLTYTWSFGDGTTGTGVSPTHTYTSAGTFTVSLTVTNTDSLTSTATAAVTISAVAAQPPVANAGRPYTGIAGTAVSFSGAASTDPKSEALTYAWSFGDGTSGTGVSPTHIYTTAGTFTASLTVTNTDTLASTATAKVTISAAAVQPPVANAGGPYSGTAGVAISFTGTASTDPQGQTLTYAWSFGDSTSSTLASPVHAYAAAGTYTVSLTVTSTGGLTSTTSTSAVVSAAPPQAPAANAGGPYTATAGNAVSFTGAASTDPKSESLTYAWSFGDGSAATGATPVHTYLTAGTYTVTLTVTNTDALQSSASTKATIAAVPAVPPVANAGGPYTGTAFSSLGFNGTLSSDPANPAAGSLALTYAWSFGDGGQGAGPTPVHTYAAAGTYTVSLIVQTAAGTTATASTTAIITAGTAPTGAPTANPGGPYTGKAGTAVTFSGSGSSDPNNLALTYNWDFGDGGSASVANPTYIYTHSGSFSVSLTVSNGTTSTTAGTLATISAVPLPALVANAGGPYTVAVNQPITLDGTKSTSPAGRQLIYAWDFGDGTSGSGSNPIHLYTSSGSYTVNLSVNDGAVSNGNATAQVTVSGPAPEAITPNAGGPYQNITGQAIVFDASSSNDNLGNPLTYAWNFGDGATGTGATPTHAYATVGNYTAVVTVSSGTATATASSAVAISAAIAVNVTTPTANAIFATNTVTVTGTTSVANLTVTVNGVAATVSGTSFGASAVSLREGVNLITATATDGKGGIGSGVVSVILDVTPPQASITSPANGSTVTTSSIAVAGLVNDIVTGTIGSNDVTVMVNGLPAQVSNRSYLLPNLQLAPGANTITVVVKDKVGNQSQTSATVQLLPPTSQLSLVKLSGDAQSAQVSTVLPQPLVVQLVSATGTPVAGRPITFTVTRSDGVVEVLPTTGQSLSVTTDANGKASLLFKLGARSGLGINQVSATTPGAAGAALFTETSTTGPPTQIHVVRGENQRGLLGQPLPEAFQIIVQDANSNPVPGVTVNYTMVGATDGAIDNPSPVTDNNGKAIANLTLGQQEGLGNYAVNADFTGDLGTPVTFTASAYAPGPVANTSVSGVVMDNSNQPVQNATVTLQGTGLSTVTNASGNFIITGAPVGTVALTVDGSTATTTQTLPFLSFVLQDLPGQNNTLGKPIYLPSIDINNAQTVGGNDPVTLTMTNVPGVAFTIAPNSVTFPDGSTVGKLSLSQVKSDLVPMEPSNGTAPNLLWTLQPAGTRFSVPVQITLPNTTGLPPGHVGEIYQYDHDLEQFVSAGTGHVSADGSVIVSDPGFGISKAGWGHDDTDDTPFGCVTSCKSTNPCISRVLSPSGCLCNPKINPGATCGKPNVIVDGKYTSCLLQGVCDKFGNCGGLQVGVGVPCTPKPDFCDIDAECSGTGLCVSTGKIPDVIQHQTNAATPDSVTAKQSLEGFVTPIDTFLKKSGLPVTVEYHITDSFTNTYTCCSATKTLNALITDDSAAPSVTINGPELPIIVGTLPLGVELPSGDVLGVYAKPSGGASIAFGHLNNTCTGKNCYSLKFSPQIQLAFGLHIPLGVVDVDANISGGFQFVFGGDCKSVTFEISTLPIVASGNVKFFTGTTISATFTAYPSQSLFGGTYPLP